MKSSREKYKISLIIKRLPSTAQWAANIAKFCQKMTEASKRQIVKFFRG